MASLMSLRLSLRLTLRLSLRLALRLTLRLALRLAFLSSLCHLLLGGSSLLGHSYSSIKRFR